MFYCLELCLRVSSRAFYKLALSLLAQQKFFHWKFWEEFPKIHVLVELGWISVSWKVMFVHLSWQVLYHMLVQICFRSIHNSHFLVLLKVPTFCWCALAFLQRFVHLSFFSACGLVLNTKRISCYGCSYSLHLYKFIRINWAFKLLDCSINSLLCWKPYFSCCRLLTNWSLVKLAGQDSTFVRCQRRSDSFSSVAKWNEIKRYFEISKFSLLLRKYFLASRHPIDRNFAWFFR